MAWDLGLKKIVLETDSASVFKILTDPTSSHLVNEEQAQRCREFLKRQWIVQVSKVFREANHDADGVANWVLNQPLGVHHLPSPPASLTGILEADIHGVGHPRISFSSFH